MRCWAFSNKLKLIILTFTISTCLIDQTDSFLYLSPPSPTTLGSTVELFCNLTNESPNAFSWLRYSYNGSNSLLLNLGTIISANSPARYSIIVVRRNTTALSYSTLTINGVIADDFAMFECSIGTNSSRANLTQYIATTTTAEPFQKCVLTTFNAALYVMIIISNLSLIITIIAIYQFITEPTNFQLLVLFGVILSSIILVIIMILFWISPSFVAGDPNDNSPVVIVSCGYASLILLWVALFIFLGFVFKNEKIIEIPVLVIVCVLCAMQLALIAAVLAGVGYCTGTTSLAKYSTDPQIVNVILGGIIMFFCFIVLALILWKHKGKKKIISIQSASYNNIRDHSIISGFFGIRSDPGSNLSPTSIKNAKEDAKKVSVSKNQLPLLPPPTKADKEKQKEKEKSKEKGKEDEKSKDKNKKEKAAKLPDLPTLAKSPESSFGSMDFDQNDLRRSTPNAEDVDSVPKTANPLLMNFIKNSNDQKNLEAIREETPEQKNKGTPKATVKTTPKTPKNGTKEEKEAKESSRSNKEKKDKKGETKKKAESKKDDDDENGDNDSINGDRGSENMFSMDPLSDGAKKGADDDEKKKTKKTGKGKTKPKE